MSSKKLAVNDYVVKRGTLRPVGIIFEIINSLTVEVKWGILDGEVRYEDVNVEQLQVVFPEIDDGVNSEPIRHNVFDQDAG